jgi:hypothetical protein
MEGSVELEPVRRSLDRSALEVPDELFDDIGDHPPIVENALEAGPVASSVVVTPAVTSSPEPIPTVHRMN